MFSCRFEKWMEDPEFATAYRIARKKIDLVNAEHVVDGDGWCWCQPRIEYVLPFGQLVIHRHFWDRPEYGDE